MIVHCNARGREVRATVTPSSSGVVVSFNIDVSNPHKLEATALREVIERLADALSDEWAGFKHTRIPGVVTRTSR